MVDDGRTTGDGRTTDGRTTEHGYTISSPCEPDGSGELIINLRIISKPHAYLQSMVTTSVKFQEDQNKTVGGVAHTRYPLSIHFIKN